MDFEAVHLEKMRRCPRKIIWKSHLERAIGLERNYHQNELTWNNESELLRHVRNVIALGSR